MKLSQSGKNGRPLNGTNDVSLLETATWVESTGNTTRFSLTEH